MFQIPLLHYFQCKNIYSANLEGMNFRVTPGKRKITGPDGTEQEESILTVDIWPDPWTLEKTDPDLRRQEVFPLSEEGRVSVIEALEAAWHAEPERWHSRPSILDCEPWSPDKAQKSPEE